MVQVGCVHCSQEVSVGKQAQSVNIQVEEAAVFAHTGQSFINSYLDHRKALPFHSGLKEGYATPVGP